MADGRRTWGTKEIFFIPEIRHWDIYLHSFHRTFFVFLMQFRLLLQTYISLYRKTAHSLSKVVYAKALKQQKIQIFINYKHEIHRAGFSS